MAQLSDRGTSWAFIAFFGLAAGLGSLGTARAALPEHSRETAHPLAVQPASSVQLIRVQLGSWRTAIEAARGWDRIQKRAGNTMDGLSPRVVPANLPGRGTFYRLWVGPGLKASAGRLCSQLQSRRIDCIQEPNDAPPAVPRTGVYQANENP